MTPNEIAGTLHRLGVNPRELASGLGLRKNAFDASRLRDGGFLPRTARMIVLMLADETISPADIERLLDRLPI